MLDGYDFDYAFIDESTQFLPDSEMLELLNDELEFQNLCLAIEEYCSSMAEALKKAFAPLTEILLELTNQISQYSERDETENADEQSSTEIANCCVPQSGSIPHRKRMPWYTSGFQ